MSTTRPAARSTVRGWWPARWYAEMRIGPWLRIMGATPARLGVPLALSLVAAGLDGLGLGLLVPMATGVAQGSFEQVRQWPGLAWVIEQGGAALAPGPGSFGKLFVLLALAAFCAAVARNAASYAAYLAQAYWSGRYLREAILHVFARCLASGKSFFDQVNQGRLQALLGYCGEVVDLVASGQRAAATGFTLAAYIGVMLVVSWRLTLFALAFLPAVQLALRRVRGSVGRRSAALNAATLEQHAAAFNFLSCIPLFQAHAQVDAARLAFADNAERRRRFDFRLAAVQGLVAPIQDVLLLVAILATIAFLAFSLGEASPADMAAFLVFFYVVRTALPKAAALQEMASTLAARAPRLRELGALLDEADRLVVRDGTLEFGGLREAIEVRDLRFSYLDGTPALHGLCATFARGTTTALVGPSGGGKSTLVHLLVGFYPTPAGSVTIDGVDLALYRRDSLRRRMAFVSQDVFLFDAPLRENLTLGRATSDAELWRALERAHLAARVAAMPAALDTVVGDRGVRLSGGERQRLAIARALLGDPEILVLDEATSALDSATEAAVRAAIREAVAGRTAIVIAHRLSTVRDADQVVVVEAGRVLEHGTPEALLAAGGLFRRYWDEQRVP